MAYAATGVTSCHEPIKAEEVLERLRLGIYVMVREGSIRRELDAVTRLKDMDVDLRRLILVSDGIEPKDFLAFRGGHAIHTSGRKSSSFTGAPFYWNVLPGRNL